MYGLIRALFEAHVRISIRIRGRNGGEGGGVERVFNRWMNGVVLSGMNANREGRIKHSTPREETVKERGINAFPNDEEWIRFSSSPTWKSGRWRALIYNLNKRVVVVVVVVGKTMCCFQLGSSTFENCPSPSPFLDQPAFPPLPSFFIPWKLNASLFARDTKERGEKEASNNFFTRWFFSLVT